VTRAAIFALAIFAPLFVLLGCDAAMIKLKPGISTATQVRKALGNPSFEWKEPDGSYTWEFPRGPQGAVTYMVDMGADHILKAVRQVLTEAYFAKIEPGMTREAVRKLIGRPAETVPYANLQEEVSTWRYEFAHGEDWFFHVHFHPDGTVKRTSRQKVQGSVQP
jgi:outer membrane protein assembly factor BamE (lipoprotein component of BamABCDE complex)